jgi:hypothetical protein
MQLFMLTGHSSQQTMYQTHDREVKQAAYSSAYSVMPLLPTAFHILLQWVKFLNPAKYSRIYGPDIAQSNRHNNNKMQ